MKWNNLFEKFPLRFQSMLSWPSWWLMSCSFSLTQRWLPVPGISTTFFSPFFSFCFCCFVGICPSVWKIGLASLIRKLMRFDWKPQRCFALDWTLTIWRRGSGLFRSGLCLKGFWFWMSIWCWPHNGHSFWPKDEHLASAAILTHISQHVSLGPALWEMQSVAFLTFSTHSLQLPFFLSA